MMVRRAATSIVALTALAASFALGTLVQGGNAIAASGRDHSSRGARADRARQRRPDPGGVL